MIAENREKYLDFEGSAVYDFLLKMFPEKVRKE